MNDRQTQYHNCPLWPYRMGRKTHSKAGALRKRNRGALARQTAEI